MANWIYIAGNKDEDRYKMGQTHHPFKRVKQLNTSSPFALSIIYAVKVSDSSVCEAELKMTYSKDRKNREWFKFRPAQVISVIDYMESNRLKNVNHISQMSSPKPKHAKRNAAAALAGGLLAAVGGSRIKKWLEDKQWQ